MPCSSTSVCFVLPSFVSMRTKHALVENSDSLKCLRPAGEEVRGLFHPFFDHSRGHDWVP